jgi:ubiquilin
MDQNQLDDILNSPMMEGLLNNPDLLKSMIMSNPSFKKIAEENPEIGRALTDPSTLKKMLEISRNPNLRNEMLRNTDMAMNNISSLPGGFEALTRMYHDVQNPLEEGFSNFGNSEEKKEENEEKKEENEEEKKEKVDTNPIPNLFGSSNSNNSNNNTSNNNNNMFGGMNFGNMGNSFGNGMNFQQMQQMMNNPMVKQMTKNLMNNPSMLKSVNLKN